MKVLRNTFSRNQCCPHTTWQVVLPWSRKGGKEFFLSPGISQMCSWSCADLVLSHILHLRQNFKDARLTNSWLLTKLLLQSVPSIPSSSSCCWVEGVRLGQPCFTHTASQYVLLGQVELLVRHLDVPHVPEYPKERTHEDQQRSGQHKKVPETQRCKDPNKEEDKSGDVENHSNGHEDAGILPLLHSWALRDGQVDVVWTSDRSESKPLHNRAFKIILCQPQHTLHFYHSTRLVGKTGMPPQQLVELLINMKASRSFIPAQGRLVLLLPCH